MLTGRELGYEVEGHEVFSDVNISVSNGDKIGLVGPNGAGKTTLLHILSGEMIPTDGEVLRTDVEVGLLPQNLDDRYDQTVYDFIQEATGVKAVTEIFNKAQKEYGDNTSEDNLVRYVEASERLGFFRVDEFDAILERSLKSSGLEPGIAQNEIGNLSGGQRNRVALAAVMATQYDVILLDEPTNNLDIGGIAILENFIKASRAAFLMVSHDRRFLRNATNRIVELMGGRQGVNNYGLGYEEYVEARLQSYESELKRYEEYKVAVKALEQSVRAKKVRANSAERGGSKRSDSDKLGANYRAGRASGHLARQANALETRLEQLRSDAPNKPQPPISLDFMFEEGELIKSGLANLSGVEVTYQDSATGGMKVLGPYDLHVKGQDRIAIVGPNGSGKSTLLKALMGLANTNTGSRSVSPEARIAYIDQNQTLPSPDKTPLLDLMELVPGLPKNEAMYLLTKFNLPRDRVSSMQSGNLSGGERAKVLLAAIAAKKANLLILDEPTNNLDIPTIEGLQEALRTYKGAIVLVSHDRDFIKGIGINQTIELN